MKSCMPTKQECAYSTDDHSCSSIDKLYFTIDMGALNNYNLAELKQRAYKVLSENSNQLTDIDLLELPYSRSDYKYILMPAALEVLRRACELEFVYCTEKNELNFINNRIDEQFLSIEVICAIFAYLIPTKNSVTFTLTTRANTYQNLYTFKALLTKALPNVEPMFQISESYKQNANSFPVCDLQRLIEYVPSQKESGAVIFSNADYVSAAFSILKAHFFYRSQACKFTVIKSVFSKNKSE
ncbi:hypothetical protein GJ496_001794 [Pomphorhynchus laevis]|nr:hypothetical protein GJ496_001794 [Pomphorhynchus laevis]